MNRAHKEILDRLSLEQALTKLTDEEREIIRLWLWKGKTFEEIGVIIGTEFRGEGPLTGGAMQYQKRKILRKLREWLPRD